MTDTLLPLPPRRPMRPMRLVLDHNPFYLMSAVSMLLGCFALLHALEPHPGQIAKLVLLLATLHVYEFLLLGLAIFLINRRGMRRDGRILLIIQSVFLADATFLTAEIFTANLTSGLIAAAAVWGLAAIKIAIAARLAPPSERLSWAATTLALLALLYLMPGYLARTEQHNGSLDRAIYLSWWLAATIVMAGAFALRKIPRDLSLVYLVAPLASIIAHLLMANWVYHVDFHAANLGPILLATSVVLSLHWSSGIATLNRKATLAALPMAAAYFSLGAPPDLQTLLPHVDLSALRLTLFVSTAIYIAFWMMHGRLFLPLAAMHFVAASLGSSPRDISAHANQVSGTTIDHLLSIFPTTAIGWGWTAVISAFVLLGAGAAISLYRPPPPIEVATDGPPPGADPT